MAQLIIDINDNVVTEVLDTLAPRWGWTAASPQTKAQYCKAYVAAWIKKEYKAQKGQDAAITTQQSADSADIT